jgi:hypothetical protein
MAQFRAVIKGQRGEASRLGNKKSGLTAHVNGWNSGVKVECEHKNGHDCFEISVTGGSNNPNERKVIYYFEQNEKTGEITKNSFN